MPPSSSCRCCLAYGASLKFECNPILAMTLAGVLLHPGIGQMLAAGKAVDFVGINVLLPIMPVRCCRSF